MSDNSNENNLMENSFQKIIKPELIYFKEEILENVQEFKKDFLKQNQEIISNISEKNKLYDKEINNLKNKIKELIKSFDSTNYLKDKINELFIFKKDILDISTSNQIKLNFLEKDTSDNIFRINKILNNSVIYPRVIGNNSKFKTFHEYIDYTLVELTATDSFRKKMEYDLKTFKIKIDKIMQSLKIKIDTSINAAQQLVKNGIKENENIMKEFINSKIFDIQIKNNELELKIEKNIKEINKQINTINNKIKEDITKITNESKMLNKSIEEFKNENKQIQNKINGVENFIQTKEKEKNKLHIDNNKDEIIEIIKNIIEEVKVMNLNLNSEKNINSDNKENSYTNIENKNQKKNNKTKNKKPNSSYINKNKNYSLDLKFIKKNKINEINEKSQYLLNNNRNNTNYTNNTNNTNNNNINTNNKTTNSNDKSISKEIKNENISDDDENNQNKDNDNNKNDNNNKNGNYKNKYNNNNENNDNNRFKKNKDYKINLDENNNNKFSLIKETINNGGLNPISQNNFIKNKSNPNLTTYNSNSLKKFKNPLKTLLKLKIDFQDLNLQVHSDANIEKTSYNESMSNKNQKSEKKLRKNYFPFTNRINNNNENKINEIYNYNYNNINNISYFRKNRIKDPLNTKCENLNCLYNIYQINLKDNSNLIKEKSKKELLLNSRNNYSPISSSLSSKTYFKTNSKNLNQLQISNFYKNNLFPS